MLPKHSVVFIPYLIIWIYINILPINAFSANTSSDPCGSTLLHEGKQTLNMTWNGIIEAANKFDSEKCSNSNYQVHLEKGNYKMEKHAIEKYFIYSSYYELYLTRYGLLFTSLSKNIELIGEVNKSNEIVTSFECPDIGFMGFVDVIRYNRNITFRNIKFSGCYAHYFKVFHYISFDDSSTQPEYRFENCIFEDNYNESIFFYEYLAGEE
ncbi:hypothetical protein PIROE2DRAFT_8940 [Piromyces sp. E2]|nr:hypothetical protein PIROE2DRAFT_8940 [Piromyces sp. E2]|eukprot:OUM64318.1 hypothetical protein PIROE2DRAFT_8940 [Piromyces sp. E2]